MSLVQNYLVLVLVDAPVFIDGSREKVFMIDIINESISFCRSQT